MSGEGHRETKTAAGTVQVQRRLKPSGLPSKVIDGVKKYEIEPGRWVTRQRLSQLRRHPDAMSVGELMQKPHRRQSPALFHRQLRTTNRLLAILIVQVANLASKRSVAEILAILQPSEMSNNEIAAALGTTAAVLGVSKSRRRAASRPN